ncbi:hypothetical protein LINGRAHAP2_LOCUS26977 [Linum grandiflorum]
MSILSNAYNLDHQYAILVVQFHDLCRLPWEVTLSYSYRETNCLADYVANLSRSLSFGIYCFDVPD